MAFNLDSAIGAYNEGDLKVARRQCQAILKKLKKSPDPEIYSSVHNILAAVALAEERPDLAVTHCATGIKQYASPHLFNTMSIARLKLNQPRKALRNIEEALRLLPDSTEYIRNKVEILIHLRRDEEVEILLKRRFSGEADNAFRLESLARLAEKRADFDAVCAHHRELISLGQHGRSHYMALYDILVAHNEISRAIDVIAEALIYHPEDGRFCQMRGALNERLGLLGEAEAWSRKALDYVPGDLGATTVLGRVLLQQDKPQEAVVVFSDVNGEPQDPALSALLFTSAEAFERVSDFRRAFDTARRANENKVAQTKGVGVLIAQSKKRIQEQAKFDSHSSVEASESSPVFLVGFPRSGTTLLGVMLDIHTGTVVHHEDRVLARIIRDDGPVSQSRDDYLQCSAELGALPDKLTVDKQPLNLVFLPRILAMFPDARFIFLQRHPMDVCLSCFFQNFVLNPDTVNFTTLESTIRYYDLVMNAWFVMEKRCSPVVHYLRYEDLVTGPEYELRNLTDFLGISWEADMLSTGSRRSGQQIATPSYSQVVKPLYTASSGRWKNYEEQIEPYRNILSPLMARFGY